MVFTLGQGKQFVQKEKELSLKHRLGKWSLLYAIRYLSWLLHAHTNKYKSLLSMTKKIPIIVLKATRVLCELQTRVIMNGICKVAMVLHVFCHTQKSSPQNRTACCFVEILFIFNDRICFIVVLHPGHYLALHLCDVVPKDIRAILSPLEVRFRWPCNTVDNNISKRSMNLGVSLF